MSKQQKVALFGGSFDPIHLGHLAIANQAYQELQLTEVIFLPCYRSPHKTNATYASITQRVLMCCRATANLAWASTHQYEAQSQIPPYAIATARYFQQHKPNAKLYWLLGADQWEQLPRWYQIDKLSKLVTFIVCQRPNYCQTNLTPHPYDHRIITTNHPAAATTIRQNFTKYGAQWLDKSTYLYATQRSIYRP